MGTNFYDRIPPSLPLGLSFGRSIWHSKEPQMPIILLQSGTRERLPERRIPTLMELDSYVCIPSNSSNTQSSPQDQGRQGQGHAYRLGTGQTDLVSVPASHVNLPSKNSPDETAPPLPERQLHLPSTTGETSSTSEAPPWFQLQELACSE